ncbi:MAG: hypothetical protein NT106_06400 [Candidatus Sumerlaeota bacterium]|nr:hypothetical protein [Candidatus Sumerlaeota bacterium]
MDNGENSLAKLIGSELDRLSKQVVEEDIKRRNSIRKYLSLIIKAFRESNTEVINKLLFRKLKDQLITYYPIANEIFERLSIDVKRRAKQVSSPLFNRISEYCANNKISLQGKLPKLFVGHLLEIELDENKHTARVGTIFLKTLDWEKIRVAIDHERHRIWDGDFYPIDFQDNLIKVHSELLKTKHKPKKYRVLHRQMEPY